jgi:transposase
MGTKPRHFVGIDISKNKLDIVMLKDKDFFSHQIITNDIKSIRAYLANHKKIKGVTIANTLFCMEETGMYSWPLISVLERISSNVVIENAYHIKTSLGLKREKSDKLDARNIALYAYKNRGDLKFHVPKRPAMQSLQMLENLRSRMINLRVALNNPLGEQELYLPKKLFAEQAVLTKDCLGALMNGADAIEKKINELISSDLQMDHFMALITSVTGIGLVTARHILISTNEFKKIDNPRKYACYAGVAPFKRSSGNTELKAKVSKIANIKVKSLLTMCAFNAIRNDAGLKAYYLRKTKVEGKSKMCVINAIRCKLIHRVFVCINQNRKYEKNYASSSRPIGA